MKTVFLCILFIFFIGGCQRTYTHPTKDAQHLESDKYHCEKIAKRLAVDAGSPYNPIIIDKETRRCLAIKFGWTTASSDKSSYNAKEGEIKDVIDGGRLYDKWWIETTDVEEPKEDYPLWKLQTTNKMKGSATWRCKECHGWDYMGKDGVYGTGSHKTGFPGVLGASSLSIEDIEAILVGSINPDHNFSNVLDDDSIYKLAIFIKKGLVDLRLRINYESKKPIIADAENGKKLFNELCVMCHNERGNELNFGSEDKKEYVGTIASNNPWELIHKVRFGEPGEIMPSVRLKLKLSDEVKRMPSGIETGYIMSDVMDILEYARSLPTE